MMMTREGQVLLL